MDGTTYGLNEWAKFSNRTKNFNNILGSLIRGTYLKTLTPNRLTYNECKDLSSSSSQSTFDVAVKGTIEFVPTNMIVFDISVI